MAMELGQPGLKTLYLMQILTERTDEEHFSANVTVTVSPQFFGWVTAIGVDMKIAGPAEVKEQYKQYLGRILGKY